MTARLRQAIDFIQRGDHKTGRRILLQLLNSDPQNERAWLWLASTVEGERRRHCLERVLEINPTNELARLQLNKLLADGQIQMQRQPPSPVPSEEAASENNKTSLGISLGIISAPVLLLAGIVGLVTVTCILCYGASFIGDLSGAVASTDTSPTRLIPPTFTPLAAFNTHHSIGELVRSVAADRMRAGSLYLDTRTEYKRSTFPDGRVGYDIDFVVTDPEHRSREEMIGLLNNIAREAYFNYDGAEPMYIFAVARAGEDDINCAFSIGIGHLSVDTFLENRAPRNLELWFSRLVDEGYYGDLPGQTDALLAFANDPADAPYCDIRPWK